MPANRLACHAVAHCKGAASPAACRRNAARVRLGRHGALHPAQPTPNAEKATARQDTTTEQRYLRAHCAQLSAALRPRGATRAHAAKGRRACHRPAAHRHVPLHPSNGRVRHRSRAVVSLLHTHAAVSGPVVPLRRARPAPCDAALPAERPRGALAGWVWGALAGRGRRVRRRQRRRARVGARPLTSGAPHISPPADDHPWHAPLLCHACLQCTSCVAHAMHGCGAARRAKQSSPGSLRKAASPE